MRAALQGRCVLHRAMAWQPSLFPVMPAPLSPVSPAQVLSFQTGRNCGRRCLLLFASAANEPNLVLPLQPDLLGETVQLLAACRPQELALLAGLTGYRRLLMCWRWVWAGARLGSRLPAMVGGLLELCRPSCRPVAIEALSAACRAQCCPGYSTRHDAPPCRGCSAMRVQQFLAVTQRDLEARKAKAKELEARLYPSQTKVNGCCRCLGAIQLDCERGRLATRTGHFLGPARLVLPRCCSCLNSCPGNKNSAPPVLAAPCRCCQKRTLTR